MGNDVFLGGIKFTPDFDNVSTQDHWYDLNGGSGRILVGVSFKSSSVRIQRCSYPFLTLTFLLGPTTHH
jgi:hypothetical protein